jgi:uncharacterized protein (TIGR01777 family)
MKIVIPGGSGQVGQVLARYFSSAGDEVVVLSRRASSGTAWRTVAWDGKTLGPWCSEFEGADAVINLAGRSVNCRYGPENRREMVASRIDSARVVGEAIGAAAVAPRVWLQASTATIYRHRFDAPNDDLTGELGGDEPGAPETWNFSISIAKAWEKVLDEAVTPKTRKVAMRSAITMSPDKGGAFDVLSTLVRRGLGGAAGDGRQFVSWIHDADFCRSVRFLIEREDLSGPVNLASPNPLPNREFMAALRSAWGVRIGLSAPAWLLEVGAFFMQTETELILKSRRVVPTRLLQAGFKFDHADWPEAARDLVRRFPS